MNPARKCFKNPRIKNRREMGEMKDRGKYKIAA